MPETLRPGRIVGLDLIRGLAIALVLVRHAWPSTIGGGGIVGVVMFFALSGYLITGLLVSDLHRACSRICRCSTRSESNTL